LCEFEESDPVIFFSMVPGKLSQDEAKQLVDLSQRATVVAKLIR
jgi:hypothetical protein